MKNQLIFLNEIPSQYEKHKSFVYHTIESFFNELKPCRRLKVKFIDDIKINEYECTDCTIKNISIHNQILHITNSPLRSIDFDGGDLFAISIYHELEHALDFNNVMNTKLFKFKLCETKQKNFEREYVSEGFFFWTEIYAYYNTFGFIKLNKLKYDEIPFGGLVGNYVKTIEHHKRIYYKQDLSRDEAEKYIKEVDSFVYLCAKYCASVYANHSRVPYARIDKNKDYKKVYNMLQGLEPKIKRILKDPYGANSYINLWKLGKYICEDLKWKKFKVGLIKHKGRIVPFY